MEGLVKKLVITSMVASLLLAAGAAFGQPAASDSHDIEIRIPNVVFLRITNGEGNDAATDPAVEFDFQDDMDTYMNAVEAGGAELEPTDVTSFGDVIVFSNRATWNVTVSATVISFENDFELDDSDGEPISGNGVDLSDIIVRRGGTPGLNVSSVASAWNLATTGPIANGVRTQGWRSLGFSGDDYRLAVNGDEDPGTYTTTVTYTIAAP